MIVESSVGSCDAILTEDLHTKRVFAKFVPRLLTDDQREQRQTIARDLFERSCEDVQFLKNTVTGDDPETKQQSSQWKDPTSPRPIKGAGCEAKQRSRIWHFLILRVSYTTSTLPRTNN